MLSVDFFNESMIFLTDGVEKLRSMQFICKGQRLKFLKSISSEEYLVFNSLKS